MSKIKVCLIEKKFQTDEKNYFHELLNEILKSRRNLTMKSMGAKIQ